MARKARHTGRHRFDDDRWRHLGDLQDAKGLRWSAYIRPAPAGDWHKVKLAVHGRAAGKANYWLSWNGERLAVHVEVGQLAETRPELHQGLLALLRERSGLDLI